MADDFDESSVIQGLKDGRREAWTALYIAYQDRVWTFVARLVGDRDAAADVVQEVFLAAARGAGRFDSNKGSLWSWLAGIAHQHTRLYWRSVYRTGRVREFVASGFIELPAGQGDAVLQADDPLERQEQTNLIRAILAELPADYASLLCAKYLEDQSVAQMCEDWRESTEAIRSRLARARREFRHRFEQASFSQE